MNTNVTRDYNLIVREDGRIEFDGTYDHTVKDVMKINANSNYHLNVGKSIYETAAGNINLKSSGSNYFNTAGTTHIRSGGNHLETAAQIHMNGPAASPATVASVAATPSPLQLFSLPNRDADAGWSNGQFYKADSISSIMQRVPTHEPWDQHENTNAERYTPTATDTVTGSTSAGAGGNVPLSNQPLPPSNGKQPSDWATDADFITKVKGVSAGLGCNYVDLLACMAFETGRTYDPALRNFIGATGLIQFISSTAKSLGTTTDYLATLTRTQQMDWVEKYFKAGPVRKISSPSLEDLYMQILWPVAVGKSNDYVLFTAGTKQYSQNNGLDIGKKGYITKSDAATKVRQQLPYVEQQLANAGYTV